MQEERTYCYCPYSDLVWFEHEDGIYAITTEDFYDLTGIHYDTMSESMCPETPEMVDDLDF